MIVDRPTTTCAKNGDLPFVGDRETWRVGHPPHLSDCPPVYSYIDHHMCTMMATTKVYAIKKVPIDI